MIDAYTIGITLALDNGVSAGVAVIRRDLAELDRAMQASALGLERLRQAAGSVLGTASAGVTPPAALPPPPRRQAERVAPAPLEPEAAGVTAAPVMERIATVTTVASVLDEVRSPAAPPARSASLAAPVATPVPVAAPAPLVAPAATPVQPAAAPLPAAPPEPAPAPATVASPVLPVQAAPRVPLAPIVAAAPAVQPVSPPVLAAPIARPAAPPLPVPSRAPPPRVVEFAAFGRAMAPALPPEVRPASPTLGAALPSEPARTPVARDLDRQSRPPRPLSASHGTPRPAIRQSTSVSAAADAPYAPPPEPSFGIVAPRAATMPAPVAPPQAAPSGRGSAGASQSGGDVFLDGVRVGRWMTDQMSRAAARPPSGPHRIRPAPIARLGWRNGVLLMFGIALLLGPISFRDFEVPGAIAFGGAQRLTVHRLPGGGRVIDAMGRDDAEITWSGTLSGAGAADRAHEIDLLRVAGLPLPLTWDNFFYTALIARFDATYQSPYWIPYRMTCTVLRDEASALLSTVSSLAVAGAQDLAAAAGFGQDVSAAQAAMAAPGAATLGAGAYGAAVSAVAAAGSQLNAALASAEGQLAAPLQAAAFAGMVGTAGQIAQLAAARGYVARTATNLANADS